MRRLAIPAVLLAMATACRHAPPAAIDPSLASCIPPGTLVLAGGNLDRLRVSPLYAELPPAALGIAEPLRDADSLLAAYNGREILFAAHGHFRADAPPAGATLLAPTLAVSGAPDLARAAAAQHRAGVTGAPDLNAQAEAAARDSQLWIAVQGNATLPLPGNLANLNRILHSAAYTTIAVRVTDRLAFHAEALCRTPEAALHLEESLRALLSLASAARGLEALQKIQLRTENDTVRATLELDPAASSALLSNLR